jgi:hypothetical protein
MKPIIYVSLATTSHPFLQIPLITGTHLSFPQYGILEEGILTDPHSGIRDPGNGDTSPQAVSPRTGKEPATPITFKVKAGEAGTKNMRRGKRCQQN